MARFCGKIGFAVTEETDPLEHPGVWEDVISEKTYYGDIVKDTVHMTGNENLNDDFKITNKFSIVADKYAYDNFQFIKYVNYMGANWKVTMIDTQFPRLILTTGGLYNGEQS